MARILTVNRIAPAAVAWLKRQGHEVGPDMERPDGILIRSSRLNPADFPGLVAVVRAGVGTNTIDVEAATNCGICVMNTPGANATAVAELTLCTLTALLRKLPAALRFISTYAEDGTLSIEAKKAAFQGRELRGKRMAVVGMGAVGTSVANLARAYGMDVVGFEAFPSPAWMHLLDPRVQLAASVAEALADADILTVHVPLLDQTRGMIGEHQLGALRKGCVVLNFAREEICDTRAVIAALDAGKLAGFATDFPTPELARRDDVLCTPHLGASTEEAEDVCADMAAKQLHAYLTTGCVTNSVNFPSPILGAPAKDSIRLAVTHGNTPGMLAKLTATIAAHDCNVEASANGHRSTLGYTLLDIMATPTEANILVSVFLQEDGILRARIL